jgi:hypothetical protein
MNVKSGLKVNNGLLYITVSLKQLEVRLYTTTRARAARRLRISGSAARRVRTAKVRTMTVACRA